MKARSVELVREAVKSVVAERESSLYSREYDLKRCDETIRDGRSQGARTRATNERVKYVEALANKEAELAEAVEALREFSEEHPS